MKIYKIFHVSEWTELVSRKATAGADIDRADGYIHFSTARQLARTLNQHFAHETSLIVAAVDADELGDDLRWENSRSGENFPHLYRHLRISDVLWTRSLTGNSDEWVLPCD